MKRGNFGFLSQIEAGAAGGNGKPDIVYEVKGKHRTANEESSRFFWQKSGELFGESRKEKLHTSPDAVRIRIGMQFEDGARGGTRTHKITILSRARMPIPSPRHWLYYTGMERILSRGRVLFWENSFSQKRKNRL